MNQVTLQISLAPSDYGHCIQLLPHQIKVFENQVDEILLTYDIHKSKGRFSLNWEENNHKMWDFLTEYEKKNPKIRLVKIDYSKAKKFEIAQKYFKLKTIPAKDWRGGPFYTYFFGLNEAKNDFVFHIDSDMFFGGMSQTWIQEAREMYESDTKILFLNPLPGPPREDGQLIGQICLPYKNKPYCFQFKSMSTRLFFVNRSRLFPIQIKNIRTFKFREFLRALSKKNPPFRLPETILSDLLLQNNKLRVDFLGDGNGLWSLHPPYRTRFFYDNLPNIISRIEKFEVPESQKGFYDIVDEFVDWKEAKIKLK
ncbi:MAG: hypothetical protein SFY32_06950 [Bacteroidota bacterium]|nr:hypothetical protein [Bacteroidota bacterium]